MDFASGTLSPAIEDIAMGQMCDRFLEDALQRGRKRRARGEKKLYLFFVFPDI